MYDFSTAERAQSDVIPAKTQVPIRIAVQSGDMGTPENAFAVTQSGLYQLVLECTVTEGPHAKRKIWQRLTMGARDGVEMTEGQQKGVAISQSFLRSVLEVARGVSPTDESPAAIEARKMRSIFELDGLEVWVELGIEEDKNGKYAPKNKITKVLPVKLEGAALKAPPAASPAVFGGAKAPAANKPSWA